mmetsp:Transcript_18393/g.56617  ORF Transcript_18393/g.56617 Transcript_18393/m.56617 type:complete len:167 (+) Transcript_18393:328-828(+)
MMQSGGTPCETRASVPSASPSMTWAKSSAVASSGSVASISSMIACAITAPRGLSRLLVRHGVARGCSFLATETGPRTAASADEGEQQAGSATQTRAGREAAARERGDLAAARLATERVRVRRRAASGFGSSQAQQLKRALAARLLGTRRGNAAARERGGGALAACL